MTESERIDVPANQYLAPENVLIEMAEAGAKRAYGLPINQVLILSVTAGGFITIRRSSAP